MDKLQEIQIIFEFWSAVFSIIPAICVFVTKKFDPRQAKNVIALLLTNAVINIADALSYLYRGDISSLGYYMVRICNFSVFLFNIILLFFVFNFLCDTVVKRGGRYLKQEKYVASSFNNCIT